MIGISPKEQRDIATQLCTDKEIEALALVDWAGMSLRPAANMLGITKASITDRLRSGRAKIAGYIESGYSTQRPDVAIAPNDEVSGNVVINLLIQRDGPTCYLCQQVPRTSDYRVEHIIPTSRGGTDDAVNLALSCNGCNGKKGAKYVSLNTTSGRPVYNAANVRKAR